MVAVGAGGSPGRRLARTGGSRRGSAGAVDNSLNLLSFARQASGLTGGNVTFYTLPIDHFGTDPIGESVNIVNLPSFRAPSDRC